MLFTDMFNIAKDKDDHWFDPIMNHDTKLFIDPFLIFQTTIPEFVDAHQKLISFFNDAFSTAAVSEQNRSDVRYRKLLTTCEFHEASEVCLGYSSAKGTNGSGSGGGFAKMIVSAIYDSINHGINELNHFEEIGLFNEGFGCDRISDATVQILKQEFITYTQAVCQKHKVEVKLLAVRVFNDRFKRWDMKKELLPENPYYPNRPVILVPEEFLRNLPSLDKEEFWDYTWENYNETLRNDFSIEVKSQVNKRDIVELARKNREWVNQFLEFREKMMDSKPYDLDKDPKGVYKWIFVTREFAQSNPVQIDSKDVKTFRVAVEKIIGQYTLFIEDNKGYRLLWNDKPKSPKSEEAAQLLFLGIVKQYCKLNNIDISKEVDIGRGPVDFKFSSGYKDRVDIPMILTPLRQSKVTPLS
jgi:hypothetical protein